ncbi:hypothetical protein [Trichococcus flocculiformis]|uniref:hypothetical protein n=1 Tax=Trichococcus flocculiformis TaxID=82803 RepID=UPI003DA3D486
MVVPKILHYAVELRAVRPKVDFSRPPVVYTNDLRSAEFQFEITDMSVTDLSTATATTLLYMRDGSFFQNPKEDVDLVGTTFSYTLKENEGNHAGVAKIQLIVTIGEAEYATQLYEFEIINGLETKVAQEVMIYDWTTLTRDARAYIDEFVANEVFRDAQFDNAQFDRNITFVETQNQRAADFTAAQDSRTATFNASEVSRTQTFTASEATREQEFDLAEAGRAAGYTADHNRAETDHTIAVDDSEQAATDHTTAINDHTLAGTDHTRAEADHTRADADSATVAGFNTRLAAEETATANNKISAVKGKTFTDVDARLEDIEPDGSLMATNLVTNGDFSNGTTDWSVAGTATVVNKELIFTNLAASSTEVTRNVATVVGNRYYVRVKMQSNSNQDGMWFVNASAPVTSDKKLHSGSGAYESLSAIVVSTASSYSFRILDSIRSGDIASNPVKLQYAIAIDLTAAFGAGNEPTAEQMDGILAKFTNSWFDGTKNLFRANATLNKLMAVDARTEFESKNAVVNGDFLSGTTGWAGQNAAVSSDNTALSITGDGTSNAVRAYQTTTEPAVISQKIYAKASVSVTDSGATDVALQLRTGGRSSLIGEVGKTIAPVANTWYEFKNVLTVPSVSNLTYLEPFPQSTYPLAADATGKVLKVKNVILINLTKTFGAGKEPTLAEMDRLMARFPNSWFDGVKPIQTIETLYQEKANKVQEAWITPTLTNGWIQKAGFMPIGYMKDELGFVHIRGMVDGTGAVSGSTAFTLPVGYRPLSSTYCIGNGSGVFASVPIATDGTVKITSAQIGWVSLEGITFKV